MYVCIFINAFRVNKGVNSLLLSGNNNSIQPILVLTLCICGFYYKVVSVFLTRTKHRNAAIRVHILPGVINVSHCHSPISDKFIMSFKKSKHLICWLTILTRDDDNTLELNFPASIFYQRGYETVLKAFRFSVIYEIIIRLTYNFWLITGVPLLTECSHNSIGDRAWIRN